MPLGYEDILAILCNSHAIFVPGDYEMANFERAMVNFRG